MQLGEPHPNPIMAAKGAGVRSLAEVVELDILIVGSDPRLVVASVERVETGADNRQPRLRHRPPSISQRRGTLGREFVRERARLLKPLDLALATGPDDPIAVASEREYGYLAHAQDGAGRVRLPGLTG